MQIENTSILTVCCSSQRVFCLGSVRSSCTDLHHEHKAATTTTGPNPTQPNSCSSRWRVSISEPRSCFQLLLSCMYTQHHSSRSSYQCNRCSGWVHAKCSGLLLNAAQYRSRLDLGPLSASMNLQSPPSPPPTHAPSAEQISDDSMFNVLQLNANGIGNKLTELGVVLERNKVNVAVIQESKLTSKSKNPCIRYYTTPSPWPLIFIHRAITFSK